MRFPDLKRTAEEVILFRPYSALEQPRNEKIKIKKTQWWMD